MSTKSSKAAAHDEQKKTEALEASDRQLKKDLLRQVRLCTERAQALCALFDVDQHDTIDFEDIVKQAKILVSLVADEAQKEIYVD